jgi:penicillin-binding protein 1A
MVAIRVANEVGGDRVIDVAHRLGITADLHDYHSLALGAQEVTLIDMVASYGAMAANGYRIEPHGVSRIRRVSSDETMWSWRPQRRELVIEERPRRYMNEMMRRVVDAGTGTRARLEGREVGGKTGTANDYRDAWFIGFTPGMVAGVWVGNDDHRVAMARVTGGSLPAEIWARFMPTTLRNTEPRPLDPLREEDYDVMAPPDPNRSAPVVIVGAPLGGMGQHGADSPPDDLDRSLDFGPEG